MKNLLILSISLFSVFNLYSQVSIGSRRSPVNLYVSEHKQSSLEYLKNSLTYFVVPEELNISVSEVENNIKKIWTLNEIKFISQTEFSNKWDFYATPGNSILRFYHSGYKKEDKMTGMVKSEYIVAKIEYFTYQWYEKESRIFQQKLADIYFTPNIKLRRDVVYSSGSMDPITSLLKDTDKQDLKNPEKSGFFNLELGYIKNYIQTLNNKLVKCESLKIRDGVKNKQKLAELKNKTLYVPDWILKRYDAFNVKLKGETSSEKIFKRYKYKYQIISNSELNKKILDNENIYYLMHTQFNQIKILSIINSLSGEIIYLTEENSYNVKSNDLKKISSLIK